MTQCSAANPNAARECAHRRTAPTLRRWPELGGCHVNRHQSEPHTPCQVVDDDRFHADSHDENASYPSYSGEYAVHGVGWMSHVAIVAGATNATWVPHVLHQTWRTADVPQRFRSSVQSWLTLQPSWRRRLWTDTDNEQLVATRYPWLQPAFRELSAIQKADIARYLYMHAFGGVYADLDVTLVQPLRPLLARHRRANASILIGEDSLVHSMLDGEGTRRQTNAVLVSVPLHPFWLDVVRHATRHVSPTTLCTLCWASNPGLTRWLSPCSHLSSRSPVPGSSLTVGRR